jgi:hypothetical protein
MRRQARAVAVGVAFVLLGVAVGLMPGCQRSYPYDLRVVVRDAADARPLFGVRVEIQGHLYLDRDPGPPVTVPDGTFAASCSAPDFQFVGDNLPTWSLVLSKDGYHDEIIDISPARRPGSGPAENRIVVVAYLRPRKP